MAESEKPPGIADVLRSLARVERADARLLTELPIESRLAMLLIGAAEARADTFDALAEERERGLAMVDIPGAPLLRAGAGSEENLQRAEEVVTISELIEARDEMLRTPHGVVPSPRKHAQYILDRLEELRR